jgi:hypothetical protein
VKRGLHYWLSSIVFVCWLALPQQLLHTPYVY